MKVYLISREIWNNYPASMQAYLDKEKARRVWVDMITEWARTLAYENDRYETWQINLSEVIAGGNWEEIDKTYHYANVPVITFRELVVID